MHGGKINNKQKINKPHTTTKTHKKKGNYSILFLHTFGYCNKWQIQYKINHARNFVNTTLRALLTLKRVYYFLKNTSLEFAKC